MKLADIVAGKVVIHQDMLAIPAFKKLYEADKKDKKHATDVISYIVLKNKPDSPYVKSMAAGDIETKLKKEFFNDEDYALTLDEQLCEDEYKLFINTRELQMLNAMRKKLDSISDYYSKSLAEELDEKKIKDLLSGMASVGNVFKSIDALEKAVKANELAASKVRGGVDVNPYELA